MDKLKPATSCCLWPLVIKLLFYFDRSEAAEAAHRVVQVYSDLLCKPCPYRVELWCHPALPFNGTFSTSLCVFARYSVTHLAAHKCVLRQIYMQLNCSKHWHEGAKDIKFQVRLKKRDVYDFLKRKVSYYISGVVNWNCGSLRVMCTVHLNFWHSYFKWQEDCIY